MNRRRIDLAFTRAGTFVMTGSVSVEIDYPYTKQDLENLCQSGEFAEFLPLEIDFADDDWEFEEIGEDTEED